MTVDPAEPAAATGAVEDHGQQADVRPEQYPRGEAATKAANYTTASQYRARAAAKQESVKWLAGALARAGLSLGIGAAAADIPNLCRASQCPAQDLAYPAQAALPRARRTARQGHPRPSSPRNRQMKVPY
jgi:hypothetical protein